MDFDNNYDKINSVKRKIYITIITIVLLIIILSPVSTFLTRGVFAIQWQLVNTFAGYDGLYSIYLNEYYCTNPSACLHEEGHREDNSLGWHSKSSEFKKDIDILSDCKTPKLSQLAYIQFVLRNDQKNLQETYAVLYSTIQSENYDTLKSLITSYAIQCV